jgi:hypothetical protein
MIHDYALSRFDMETKQTNVYKNLRVSYIKNLVSRLHVHFSATSLWIATSVAETCTDM